MKTKKRGIVKKIEKKVVKSKSLKDIHKDNLNYIRQSKSFIFIVIGIFFLFFLVGFFIPAPDYLQKEIFELLKQLAEKIQNLSGLELILYIFFNNLFASLFGLVFGILFGIFSITSSITNGYVLGFVSSMSVNAGGILTLWKLIPHGIFEFPAIFISLGLGLKLGFPFVYRYFKYYSDKKNSVALIFGFLFLLPAIGITLVIDKKLRAYQLEDLKQRIDISLSVFFFVIVPLLIVAAIIEGLLISFL